MEEEQVLDFEPVIKTEPIDYEEPMKRIRKPINFEEKFSHLAMLKVKRKYKSCKVKCISCRHPYSKSWLTEVEIKSKKFGIRKVLKCENCKLKVEVEKPKVPDVDVTCDICGIVKKSKALMRIHVQCHLNLSCEACNSNFSSRSQLLLHLSKHFRNFVCHHCGQNFNFIEKLKKHLRKNHDPKFYEEKGKAKELAEKGNFPCRFCPYVLNNRVSLLAHEYRLHKDGKSEFQFKCGVCGKGFYSREDHRVHGFEHFTGKIRYCDFPGCTKFFRTGKLLGIHKKTHQPPKHECTRCGSKFVQSSGLLKHKKRFCKFLKQPKAALPPEEMERIATIAKAQYENYRAKKPAKVEPIETFEENLWDGSDEIDDESSPMLEEVETENKETKAEKSEFLSIDIKEEPIENDETWEYEYLDEAVVKCEEIIDENPQTNPVVLLIRLEDAEIEKWKSSNVEFENDFELPQKPRKLYNDGKRRRIYNGGKPRKVSSKRRVKRKLQPGEFYTCDMCGKQHNNWMAILVHVTTVHKPIGDFPCEYCKKLFKSSGNLNRHVLSIHKNIRSHVCHVCAKAFNTNSKLMHHLKTHDEPEVCKICGKLAKNMADHIRRHTQSVNKTFLACPTCGKLYDKNVLPVHIDRVHGKSFNGNIFRCDDCDINYTRREDWRQHNYTTHFDGEVYNCPKCEKVFRTKKLLRYHRHTHDPANIECKICFKTFTRQAGLYKHRKLKHPETVTGKETEIC